MNKQKMVRFSLILLWVAILLNVILTPIATKHLSVDVLKQLATGPLFICQQALATLYIGALAISTYLIWTKSLYARRAILISIGLFAISVLALTSKALYVHMESLEEFSLLIVGFLYVYVGSEIQKKEYSIKDLRMLVMGVITLIILMVIYLGFHHYLEVSYSPIQLEFPDSIAFVCLFAWLISLVMLCFKSKVAKYLTPILTIILTLNNLLVLRVVEVPTEILNDVAVLLSGVILGLLYFPEFSQKFTITNLLNPARLMLQSFYSKAAYKKVAVEKKGYGFLYLFVLLIPLVISQVYLCYERTALPGVINAFENTNIAPPIMQNNDGVVTIAGKSSYILRDQANKEVLVYDDSGKYKSLGDVDHSVQILQTSTRIYVRQQNGRPVVLDYAKKHNTFLEDRLILALALREIAHIAFGVGIMCVAYFMLIITQARYGKSLQDYDFATRMRVTLYSYIPLVSVLILFSFTATTTGIVVLLISCVPIIFYLRSSFLNSLS